MRPGVALHVALAAEALAARRTSASRSTMTNIRLSMYLSPIMYTCRVTFKLFEKTMGYMQRIELLFIYSCVIVPLNGRNEHKTGKPSDVH